MDVDSCGTNDAAEVLDGVVIGGEVFAPQRRTLPGAEEGVA